MAWKSWTLIFIVVISLIVIAVDVFLAFWNKETEDTISEVIRVRSWKNPVYPFIFGFLMGHWFW